MYDAGRLSREDVGRKLRALKDRLDDEYAEEGLGDEDEYEEDEGGDGAEDEFDENENKVD